MKQDMTPALDALPPPGVVETLDFERILDAHRADLLARHPEAAEVLALECEPLNKLLEAHAYRELLYRARVNDAARAHLIAFAQGSDLDHKGAFYDVARLPGESDERYRQRILLRVRALAGSGTAEHYEPGAPVDIVARLQAGLAAPIAAYALLGRDVPRSWITTRLHVDGIARVTYPDALAPAELTPLAADEYPVLGRVQLVDEGLQA